VAALYAQLSWFCEYGHTIEFQEYASGSSGALFAS